MRAQRALMLALAFACALFMTGAARAVQPDEMLKDPALEERARAISEQLRCMVCQNESIDESNADLAHDLRVLVRDRLKRGDTDQEVIDYIASRYGEFVLLKPRFDLRNALLWGTPLIVLVGGGLLAWTTARGRSRQANPLSADEEERLRQRLDKA